MKLIIKNSKFALIEISCRPGQAYIYDITGPSSRSNKKAPLLSAPLPSLGKRNIYDKGTSNTAMFMLKPNHIYKVKEACDIGHYYLSVDNTGLREISRTEALNQH
jgi:hypothetical protein